MHYVYILQSLTDGTYYVGSTQDIDARLERHNQGRSRYTRLKRPWKLVYYEAHPDRSSAVRRETAIKRQKRISFIEALIKNFEIAFTCAIF
jgi:putative endonuclease